jgi:uncharacterized protein YdeI (YjbR/CyaY-like superfamily)
MKEKEKNPFYPAGRAQWRNWLEENHATEQSVWILCYKMKSGVPTLSWSDAVEEALCFGWIDSTRKTVDSDSFIQFFTRRKAVSTWSKVNKEKVQRLIDEGLMREAGFKSIELAKNNGSWTVLDAVEDLLIPEDLEWAFAAHAGSGDYFSGLSKSVKKMMLTWIAFAKRPETRQKRIDEIASLAAKGLKPNQFR